MRRRQGGYAALIVLIVLALAIGAAVYYKHEYDAEHDRATAAETKLTTANAETQRCNDSIAGLEEAAREQGARAEKDRQAAEARRAARNKRADKELATPPTVPGDDCRSAQDRVKRILGERKTP